MSLVSPPEEFICPLTMDVMKVPVLCKKTGKHYERSSIMEWLYFGSPTCPLTRTPLSTSDLVRNYRLEREIKEWVQTTGYESESSDEFSCDDESDNEEQISPFREETKASRAVCTESLLSSREHLDRLADIRNRVLARRDEKLRRYSGTSQ